MSAWKRWQDWVIVVLGVLLFIAPLGTPFVFGGVATASAAYTTYAMGVLIAAIGLFAYTARIIGALAILLAGSVILTRRRRPAPAH